MASHGNSTLHAFFGSRRRRDGPVHPKRVLKHGAEAGLGKGAPARRGGEEQAAKRQRTAVFESEALSDSEEEDEGEHEEDDVDAERVGPEELLAARVAVHARQLAGVMKLEAYVRPGSVKARSLAVQRAAKEAALRGTLGAIGLAVHFRDRALAQPKE